MKNMKERAGNSLQALLKLEFWQRQKLQEALAINVNRLKTEVPRPVGWREELWVWKVGSCFRLG